MSHSYGLVVVPKGTEDVMAFLNGALAPYEETTENGDKARWDFWRVGGRWDGAALGIKRKSEDKGFNFDDRHEQLLYNQATIKDVLRRLRGKDGGKHVSFFLLTPSGWHETGMKRAGWDGSA